MQTKVGFKTALPFLLQCLHNVALLQLSLFYYCYDWRKLTDPRFVGAIYSGRNVVQDGNIITSGVCPYLERMTGLPDQTTKLTELFIAELKKK